MIISAWWLRTSSKFSGMRSQRINRKTRKWTTLKRVRIRPKYSANVAFSRQEDKDGTKQTTNKHFHFICITGD